MTAQYWSRKIEGGYVYHQGRYTKVNGIQVQDRLARNDVVLDFRYPEQYLPYIKFITNDGHTLNYEDFEVRFPDEGYKLLNNKARIGLRTMERAWRIVPHRENWGTPDCELGDWLNQPYPEFDKPEALHHWDRDHIFSPYLADQVVDAANKTLMYKGTTVAQLVRKKDDKNNWVIHGNALDNSFEHMKDNLWGGQLLGIQKYKLPKPDPYTVEQILAVQVEDRGAGLFYVWRPAINLADLQGSNSMYKYYADIREDYAHIYLLLDEDDPEVVRCSDPDIFMEEWDGIIDQERIDDIIEIQRRHRKVQGIVPPAPVNEDDLRAARRIIDEMFI